MKRSADIAPTVFVVDSDRQVRESLSRLLDEMGFSTRSFAAAGSFHRFYRPHMPGCLLLDMQTPVQDGLGLYERLLHEGKRLPVIFVTARADVATAVAAMKRGAIDFLEKPFDRHSLLSCIQKALSADSRRRQREAEYIALDERIGWLSHRERDTLALLLAGESNKTMASKLFVTERAVEMRRAAIMRKLHVRSLVELLDLIITHRILSEMRHATDANGASAFSGRA